MASSVAAMPHDSASCSWRDPSRPTPSRGFFNILIPPPQPASTSFSSSSSHSPSAAGAASAPASVSSASACEPTPRRRRQILERWAAAAAAVTAGAAPAPADQRRRARDAELTALASATRPVAARAAVFREPSPAPSDASSTAAAAASAPSELPPAGPRASSLIQRWREIEAVGPATPRPGDPAAAASASASDSDTGSPRGRVGCIVKKLSGASSLPEDELDDAAAKSELSLSLSQSAPPSPAPMRDAAISGPRPPHLVVRTVRGRRAMEELVAAMAHRRRREVAALADRHAVSRFAHKGRIQSMLRLRLLRQRGTVEDELWTLLKPVRPHQPKHVGESRYDSRDTDLREANSYSQQNNGKCSADERFCIDRVSAEEKSIDVSVEGLADGSGNLQCDEQMKIKGTKFQKDCKNFCDHSQKYSEASSFARYDEHSTIDDNQYVEDISPSTTSTLHELQTPSSRGDNLREEDNQSINGSWEDRGLWISNLGWPAPIDTMSPDSWHRDTMGGIENHSQIQFNDRPWIDSPNSWRSLSVVTQSDCRALSRNADICNLLESKMVSKSLEGDFSNKMNQLLLRALHKQRQQRMMDDFGGYYDERMYWRQDDEIHNVDKEASAPCSLAPVSHLESHQQENWQHSSFGNQQRDNQNLLEMEVRVRSEMSQIHHEIYELRKLVESCIASQVKMQHSIKEEVCSAFREAGLMPSQTDTDTAAAKRGSCCICHRVQVDSLLYRCGHMCTCFDCADQLKSSGRSCPICQSPIDDVVRAQLKF